MRQFNKFKGTKGFIALWEYMLRFRYMITEQAKERVRILAFWEKHGTEATIDAFHVSQRTLFRWQKALKRSKGKLDGLNPISTAPKARRKRIISSDIVSSLVELRTTHPRIGKDKIHAIVTQNGYTGSTSTIGRILTDLKQQGRIPAPVTYSLSGKTGILIEQKPKKRKKKLRRPKGYRVLEVDTVVRFVDGVKRYIVTCVDTERRTAFAACYTNHGSASAADFLSKARIVLPDCPSSIQTDNGSEFALHFSEAVDNLGLVQFHTYPHSPKMNGHVERFNRTLEEEFLRYNRALMRDDVGAFNQKLIDWLLWYNGERPHYALGQVSPFRYMMSLLPATDCQMWWTHTVP